MLDYLDGKWLYSAATSNALSGRAACTRGQRNWQVLAVFHHEPGSTKEQ